MSVLKWGPALEVGFGDIDAQHRRLVDITNGLAAGVRAGNTQESIAKALHELVHYTKFHFAFEENLMAKYGLDEDASHQRLHNDLTNEVLARKERFLAGENVADDLIAFLAEWLRHHILGTDMQLAAELREAGAVSATASRTHDPVFGSHHHDHTSGVPGAHTPSRVGLPDSVSHLATHLDKALNDVVPALDTDKRAWMVASVALADTDPGATDTPVTPDAIIDHAFSYDTYPAVPCPFDPATLTWEKHGSHQVCNHRVEAYGDLHFDVMAASDSRTWVGKGLTRAVLETDGTGHPTHVMLTDVEAVIADALTLGQSMGELLDYNGPAVLAVDIISDSDTAPLELRSYDEDQGDKLRPEAGFNTFTPVRTALELPLTDESGTEVLWNVCRTVAEQFGVYEPQMVPRP